MPLQNASDNTIFTFASQVSVPSMGDASSKQRKNSEGDQTKQFQYPLWVMPLQNAKRYHVMQTSTSVSVPSMGDASSKRGQGADIHRVLYSFSTLYG